MKKISILCITTALAMSVNTTAHADWGRHHGGGFREYEPMHHQHHRGGSGWVGPAAVLAIAGLALGTAIASQSYHAPAQVYSAPPMPMPVADYGTWYYCGSSGQYYPYTNACPEGWQAVQAR